MLQRLTFLYSEALFRLKRIGLLLIGGLLVISAVLMLLGGSMIYGVTRNWPHAKGQLQKFDLRPMKNRWSHVELVVVFSYSVDGKEYQGEYFSPMTRPGKILRHVGHRKQQRYHAGDAVDVIHDPRDPSVGYLEAPDLFWDVSLIPVSIGALGMWLLYLFVKTKRRVVPDVVAAQQTNRFEDDQTWKPIVQSVLERDHVVVEGIAAYSATGGLLAGWPQCRVALIASPNEFAVVPGPFTKRGVASSLLTLLLEFSLSRFWLPAIHGLLFLTQAWKRRQNWQHLNSHQLPELAANPDRVHVVSIDEAVVYGYERRQRRLWYRLPGKRMDEFVQLPQGDDYRADEIIAFIGLMQKAAT
ncbi:MAG: DUF3592 domain-containing protein [Rubripirellula sp.]